MKIIKTMPILLSNTTPSASSSNPIGDLISILFWVARVLIIAIGGGIGLFKLVKGKSDENPKETTDGFGMLIATGLLFGASFAIEAIFK